jgi:phosphate transport system substrate-binding protein
MKKNIPFLLSIALVLASCGDNKTETTGSTKTKTSITIKGSDSVLPLSQKEAENFMKSDSLTALEVTGGGSGVGIKALLEGGTDIAMSSRELKMEEKLKFQEMKKEYEEKVISFDALAVVVNPTNKITQLTREQLEGIFTGMITNWKQIGGDDAEIIVYSRETSSGTYEFFKEHVMDKKNYAGTVLNSSSTGAIVQSVSQTKGAIGYVGLPYINTSVKALAVSYDQGKTFIAPSVETAKSKTYPIARPLFFYYLKSSGDKVNPFVNYIFSAEGQKIAGDEGYIPIL